MSNMLRGQVRLPETGDTPAATLRLDVNALCRLEEDGGAFEEIAEAAQSGRLIPLRRMVWALMLRERPEATEAEAGDLISAHGFVRIGAVLAELFQKAGLAAQPGEGAPGEDAGGNAPGPGGATG